MTPKLSEYVRTEYVWASARIGLGFIILWAFLDKTFGLGFATKASNSWINGGSPTTGFLKFATSGIFEGLFTGLAGNAVVDVLFMLALLLVGVALILGVGMKIATISGGLLMLLLWMANVPPANNPILDEHIIYLILLIGLMKVRAGQTLGLGKWWSNMSLVKRFPILE
jgi:thiosulfate dehydrogenase [quinone] large subunit